MEPFPYTHPQAPHGLGVGLQLSDYFVPKLEVLDTLPSSSRMPPSHHPSHPHAHLAHSHHLQLQQHDIPPPLTEIPILRTSTTSKPSPIPLKHAHYYAPLAPSHEDASRSSSLSSSSLAPLPPPSPPYEEDPTSPTFFVDTFTKIRNLSGELFQVAGDTLAKGYATDNVKIEYYAHELLKIARQLNNTTDDDDRKRLPPPLVRPRRIRRKHNEEEEQQQQQQIEEVDRKRKLGTGATPELYCHSCGTTDTPEWRRGPDGCKSLCNACGLHYAKILRRETMIPNRQPARTTMTLNNLLN